jgi:hypothetical protein
MLQRTSHTSFALDLKKETMRSFVKPRQSVTNSCNALTYLLSSEHYLTNRQEITLPLLMEAFKISRITRLA